MVGAAFVVLFSGFGVAYSFGAFFLPLAETFRASRAEVSAVFAYAASLIFITGALSGHLADRFGPRRVVLFGTAAIVAGLAGSAAAASLTAVTAWFTLGVGMGVGFVYVPSIGTVQRWFTRRRALASGIAVTGIGLGTLAMPLLAGHLLATLSWRQTFLALAVMVTVLCLPAIGFLSPDPARRGMRPDGEPGAPSAPAPSAAGGYRAVLLSRAFVQLYAAQMAMSFVVLLPFVHLVPHAEDQGIAPTSAVALLSLVGIGSTVGRIMIGGIADRLGRQRTLSALFAAAGAAYALWAGATSFTLLAAFALGYGTVYGGFIALMPALLADHFAGPRLASIIGLQYTSAAVGSLLGPIAAGYIFDTYGSYTMALAGAAVMCLVAAALIAGTPPPPTAVQAGPVNARRGPKPL